MSADYPWQVVVARELINPGKCGHGVSLVEGWKKKLGKGYTYITTPRLRNKEYRDDHIS